MAVVAVLLFHGGFETWSGGFLGVSTFFTLSGYLVASILIAEHDRDHGIDVRGFAERRLRRLLPAALVAVAICLVVGRWLGAPSAPSDLRWQAISSASFWANWRFLAEGKSYGALFATPSAFDHFWSLAIEAQLYVVAPLLVWVTLRVSGGRRRALSLVLAAVAIASTVLCITLFHPGADNGRVYYGTDTRAAEFLVGALVASLLANGRHWSRPARLRLAALGSTALALLVALTVVGSLTDAWVYRGGFALNAIAAAVVIVALVARAPVVGPVLELAPLRWLGRVSYGVYLYHWPVFLIFTTKRLGWPVFPTFLVRVAVSFALAAVSAAVLEKPIRTRRGRRWWIGAPVALAAVVVVALVVSNIDRPPAAADRAGSPPPLVTAPTSAGPGTTAPPHVFTITSVGDADGRSVAGHLATDHASSTIRYDGVEPLGSSWSQSWTAQVRAHDADLLLVSVTDADAATLTAAFGEPAPQGAALRPWLTARLRTLVASVTATGAAIVWLPVPDPNGKDLVRLADPTYAALIGSFRDVFGSGGASARFLDIQSEYNDRVREGRVDDRLSTVADLAAPRLAAIAQSSVPGVLRVMVVGDSVARSLANGLVSWGADGGAAAVWDVSRDGCGVWVDGNIQSLYAGTGPLPAACIAGVARWPQDVRDFRPDVVVVLSTIWDLADRKLPSWSSFRRPGEATFDAALLARYRAAIGDLSATGARVVWMTAPCTDPDNGGLPFGVPRSKGAFDPTRSAHLNHDLLPQLGVRVVDLDGLVCPGGRFTQHVGPVSDARPDGLHFSEAGARWLADTYASDWLERP